MSRAVVLRLLLVVSVVLMVAGVVRCSMEMTLPAAGDGDSEQVEQR